jgi:carboxylesterase type B
MRVKDGRNAALWMFLTLGAITSGCLSHGAGVTPVPAPPTAGLPECTTGFVETSGGPVCGLRIAGADQKPPTDTAVDAYLGIRYGAAGRWEYATLHRGTEPTVATAFGEECIHAQLGTQKKMTTVGKEDCFFVNVWTPAERGREPLPVLVFIPGGGFIIGGTNGAVVQGWQVAAAGKVVVVTFNYRLGAFAGLGGGKGKNELRGDYGFADQQLALQWVQKNIAGFGGDPGRVTLWGESSGAQSVALHLVAPGSRDLFQAAILESNPYGLPYKETKAQADVVRGAFDFAAAAHCPWLGDLDCLKKMSPLHVLEAQSKTGFLPVLVERLRGALAWSPMVGTERIPIQPIDVELGKPTILGTNLDEGLQFAELGLANRKELSREEYDLVLLLLLGGRDVSKVTARERYAPGAEGVPGGPEKTFAALQNVFTDYLWTCPNRRVLQRAKADAWGYFFVHGPSYNVWPLFPGCTGLPCHSYELPFTFRRPYLFEETLVFEGFTPQEQLLSDRMSQYWVSFSADRDPNRQDQPAWPRFAATSPGERLIMNLPEHDSQGLLTQDESAHCDLWDEIGYGSPAAVFEGDRRAGLP